MPWVIILLLLLLPDNGQNAQSDGPSMTLILCEYEPLSL